eukprot:TRINITY_DN2008_c0_g1_i71.p1 TRINITY_DN2008_c0_g1~~TRINITY_DN2008_c0_g1_i71.p1  ORF type:complete len:191 (+),score=29.99 TRINITY_DN2008_c0_g1_i71:341-913(+)
MHSNPSLSGTTTRQPRKPQPASVAAHAQQPFAEWHHTRQPRKPRSACGPVIAESQQPFAEAPYPTASESSISLCSLSGTIPDSLGSLDQLVDLLMHSNPLLSGTVPDSLGSLSQLSLGADLYMYSNPLLSGTLPDSLGSLSQLQWLLMHSNPLLSGTVPDSLGRASASFSASPRANQLVYLYMYSNPASR